MGQHEEEVEQQGLIQVSRKRRGKEDGDVSEVRELPHDLITMHILTRLPVKSVLRFKLVSKQWCTTLSSCQFGNAHLKLSSLIYSSIPNHFVLIQSGRCFYLFTYNEGGENGLFRLEHYFRENDIGFVVKGGDEVVIIGSCNGLVCLGSLYDFILWNPVTGRSKKFDSDPDNRLNLSTTCRVSWGFGYVAYVDDFKVVRIIELPLTFDIMVHVFSMKSNCWREIDSREYDHVLSLRSSNNATIISSQRYLFHTNRGVVCDEKVNWIAAKLEERGTRVVSFNMINETFDTYYNPDLLYLERYWDKFICVMQGCLSVYRVSMRGDVSICVYERPGEGCQGKEIHLCRDLGLDRCADLIDMKNGKLLVLQRYGEQEIGVVDSSLAPMTYKRLTTIEEKGSMHFTRHVPSLVSPREIEDS